MKPIPGGPHALLIIRNKSLLSDGISPHEPYIGNVQVKVPDIRERIVLQHMSRIQTKSTQNDRNIQSARPDAAYLIQPTGSVYERYTPGKKKVQAP